MASGGIKAIDQTSVHRITSGQVVVDLQTAVKELVENSVDAGATNIEVRFKQHGLGTIEVIDNGHGIAEADFEGVAMKHHTSKLQVFEDLTAIATFGFRGEALSSLCALCEEVKIITATAETAPKGTSLEMSFSGEVKSQQTVARKQGTTVIVSKLFAPLPVRRKEFERHVKREFAKAIALLQAYALGPCTTEGIRLSVSNQTEKGQKSFQWQTQGVPSLKTTVSALWGPKAMDNLVDFDISFSVDIDKTVAKRMKVSNPDAAQSIDVSVKGLTSKFAVGCGRLNADRQFFYLNGRPCNMSKVQKAFNEVYRTFNVNQVPFLVADFIVPTDSIDINVSPDKRTVLIHNEDNLISALKDSLEAHFSPSRSTFETGKSQGGLTQSYLSPPIATPGPSGINPKPEITINLEDETAKGDLQDLDSDDVPSTSTTLQDEEVVDVEEDDTLTVRRVESGTPMDIDPVISGPSHLPPVIPAARPTKSRENEDITLDTRRASWGGKLSSHSILSEEEPERPNKRRRLRPSMDSDSSSQTLEPSTPPQRENSPRRASATNGTTRRASKMKQSTLSSWSKLAAFAATGPQLSKVDRDHETDDESETEEESAEPESISDSRSPPEHARDNSAPRDVIAIDLDEDVPEITDVDDDLASDDGRSGDQDDSGVADAEAVALDSSVSSFDTDPSALRPEIIRQTETTSAISFKFDMDRIASRWSALASFRSKPSCELGSSFDQDEPHGDSPKILPEAGVSNSEDNSKASDALARVIAKEDFASMAVIGQFNLGFIIVRRHKHGDNHMDDLFIVDQHAADEKYNFETLQLTTRIQSQKLIRPRILELTAADELLATDNIDVLRSNGFEVEVLDDEITELPISTQGGRLKLIAQPVSKSTVFDMKDLEEVIHLLRDAPTGTMVRCSKARAMFAMRACRRSVMVGMPLNNSQMVSVVRHMGTMDQPWNCPHGRPTMRHLADITTAGRIPSKYQPVDWTAFTC